MLDAKKNYHRKKNIFEKNISAVMYFGNRLNTGPAIIYNLIIAYTLRAGRKPGVISSDTTDFTISGQGTLLYNTCPGAIQKQRLNHWRFSVASLWPLHGGTQYITNFVDLLKNCHQIMRTMD